MLEARERFAILTDIWNKFRSLSLISYKTPDIGPGDDGFLWIDIGVDGTPENPIWKMWDEAARTWRQIGGSGGSSHPPVTLDGDADDILTLNGQQIGLQSQAANQVLASPNASSGKPTFRSLVVNDLPPEVLTEAEHTAIGNAAPHHAPVTLSSAADAVLQLSGQQLDLDSQAANQVFASPASGSGQPAFRSLSVADLPTEVLTEAEHTAIGNNAPHHAPVTLTTEADGLLQLSGQQIDLDAQSANQVLAGPTSGSAKPTFRALTIGDLPSEVLTETEHTAIGNNAPHHAPVTLASDADAFLALSGQQISLDNQNPNTVLAGPASGGAAKPTFRALTATDLPTHKHSSLMASDGDPDPAVYCDASGRLEVDYGMDVTGALTITAGYISLPEIATPAPVADRALLYAADTNTRTNLFARMSDAIRPVTLGQGARVYHNANIALNSATITILPFNSERFDNDNIHDTTTNTSRLTCQTPGVYLITGCVRFAANATGQRQIHILLNGSTIIALTRANAAASGETDLTITTIYSLAAGNYVELAAWHNSGAALNVVYASAFSPEFAMIRIG
ncbi:MAG: hypothetical protein RMK79_12485 [Anaerolineae bacterium]|nr:hypothetical protein [Anaerolineae bacterium]